MIMCPAVRETRFHSWAGKICWRREGLPTLVFLPGEFHGQRSLVGYSPWGKKELDTTEQLKKKKTTKLSLTSEREREREHLGTFFDGSEDGIF